MDNGTSGRWLPQLWSLAAATKFTAAAEAAAAAEADVAPPTSDAPASATAAVPAIIFIIKMASWMRLT